MDTAGQHSSRASSRGERSREGILSAAARLFRQQGYAAVSLRNIATEAGMKAGSIYHHFESKERIVEEILNTGVESVFNNVRQAIEALPKGSDHPTRIRAGITAHLQAMHAHSNYTSAYLRIFWQLPDTVRQTNVAIRLAYEGYWRDLLEAARKDGYIQPDTNLTIFRRFLFGALNASMEWFDLELWDVETIASDYADILLRGLSCGPGEHQ